jgi:4-alpha-glucanotransferase
MTGTAMAELGRLAPLPPFPADYRGAGVLLHVTSLPGRYGIGDIGPAALAWLDRLAGAGQGWWQALPLGPTGYLDSPYQALSSFAGNALLISPDALIEEGLLRPEDCRTLPDGPVDYGAVIALKHGLLNVLWTRFREADRKELNEAFAAFCHEHAHWLDDYALFRALKAHFNGAWYLQWPDELVRREPGPLAAARREMAGLIDRIRLAQFILFRQAARLRQHARARGVRLIGDLPFFVSPDSSDVWAHPQFFLLDERRRPRVVAGVPPDEFSAVGQHWGNPIYDWDALARDGYRWCIERFRALLAHVDVVRLDHFRAFAAAWHIPADAEDARTGEWVAGPGAAFFDAVRAELGGLPFIAEDLGVITPDVSTLLDRCRLPGNRVLQFAFDGLPGNPHLPARFVSNTVVYTGTHDNPTTRGWFEGLSAGQRQGVGKALRRPAIEVERIAPELIGAAWRSRAALAVVPLQDLLNLGAEARMNNPGRPDGNWRWRCTQEMLRDDEPWNWLKELTDRTKRSGGGAGD